MGNSTSETRAPIFAVSRLRMGVDGPGITTLVTFMGCPLRCRYCLNKRCHEPIYEADGRTPRRGIMLLTPKELYDMVKIDDIYFQTTGGGICFGGGEPTLYPEFISEFRAICGHRWKITLETSLCCSHATKRSLSEVVDYWIVDIKSIHPTIYEAYTGESYSPMQLLSSLKMLVPEERVMVRVPRIPGYNTDKEVTADIEHIKKRFHFSNVIKTEYYEDINMGYEQRKREM
jgi:pyruvate formate lyase activating enzyme